MVIESGEKVKVIYIAGAGRSGSTLLDMIISTSDQVFSVGEVYNFNDIMKRDAFCACGERVSQCKFWGKLHKEQGEIKIKNHANFRDYLKILNYLYNPLASKKIFSENAENNHKIFSEVMNYGGAENKIYILDSSKDVGRLIELNNDPGVDLYCIHVARDPRGVVNSYSSKTLGGQQNIFSIITKWLFMNIFIQRFIKIKKLKNLVLSYDNFCGNSINEIKRIEEYLGIEIPTDYSSVVREMDYHNIGGNRMSKKSNRKMFDRIRFDCKWKKELSKIRILIVDLFCVRYMKKIKRLS